MGTTRPNQRRVLIIGLDGLRPDWFDASEMPVLANLAENGLRFGNQRSVYPPHTQAAIASLATGCYPGQHGLMGNRIVVPGFSGGEWVDTADFRMLDRLDASEHKTLLVPSLGNYLATIGEHVAVASFGNGGAASLWTRNDLSQIVNVHTNYDRADVQALQDRLGTPPPKDNGPQVERARYVTRAVIDLFLADEPEARVIVLWFDEPDASYHAFGIGSPESRTAMRVIDECIGDVVATLDRNGQRNAFDIFVMSDHGQTTIAAPDSLGDYLEMAANELGPWVRSLVAVCDGIYPAPGCTAPTDSEQEVLVAWLSKRPEVDRVFFGAGSFEELWNGKSNPRAPLIAVSPVVTDELNQFGVPGTALFSTVKSRMRTSHGALSPYDMNAFLIANGPSFAAGRMHDEQTAVVDILPTILEILGIAVPSHLDGRSLL